MRYGITCAVLACAALLIVSTSATAYIRTFELSNYGIHVEVPDGWDVDTESVSHKLGNGLCVLAAVNGGRQIRIDINFSRDLGAGFTSQQVDSFMRGFKVGQSSVNDYDHVFAGHRAFSVKGNMIGDRDNPESAQVLIEVVPIDGVVFAITAIADDSLVPPQSDHAMQQLLHGLRIAPDVLERPGIVNSDGRQAQLWERIYLTWGVFGFIGLGLIILLIRTLWLRRRRLVDGAPQPEQKPEQGDAGGVALTRAAPSRIEDLIRNEARSRRPPPLS